jgi:sugar lactone lactonase YvrE
MDELIRAALRDALEVQEPAGLRHRVIASVPIDRRRPRAWRIPTPGAQWAATVAAFVLTAALIAGLVYSRGLGGLSHPVRPAPSSPVRLSQPEGIAAAPDGSVYVADYLSNRVFRLQPDGTLVTVAGGGFQYEGPATKANIYGPVGLAVAPNGDLFIAESPGTTIRRVDRNGNLTTFMEMRGAGQTGASLNPAGVAIDSSGLVYAGFDGNINVIQDGAFVSTIDLSRVPGPVAFPGFLAFDATSRDLYVGDLAPLAGVPDQVPPAPGGCRIFRIAPDHTVSVIAGTGKCGYSGDGGPAVNAELDDPKGIAFDAAGNVYFADSHNFRIRRIDARGVITTVAGNSNAGSAGSEGAALSVSLPFVEGLAMVQGRFLYFSERNTNYGAVAVLDLQTGIIRDVVNSYSRVVS